MSSDLCWYQVPTGYTATQVNKALAHKIQQSLVKWKLEEIYVLSKIVGVGN